MQNIGISLLVIMAITIILSNKDKTAWVNFQTVVGILALFTLVMLAPFLGFLLIVPTFLVTWFDKSQYVWSFWDSIKTKTLKKEA